MSELRIRRPAEGWITLALVAALALIVAWAIDEPGYVNGRGELTDCLGTFALLGVLVGFAGPKLGWGRWTTHLMGALFAAVLIPVVAGWTAYPGTALWDAFHRVAEGSVNAYLDLAWRQLQLTSQEIHYTVVFGWIVWGTSQFASYAVFGHRRPMAAIVVLGLVLLGNMVLAPDQLTYVIAFTACALFLLIEMHAFDERATWIRRRIGDPSTISSLYLRGGTVFIVAALIGSMFLTQRAASAPLAGAWTGINDQLIELGQTVSRWLPVGGNIRPLGSLTFGNVARISPRWVTDDKVAFTATVPKEFQDQRWRAATYDTFVLSGWVRAPNLVAPAFVNAGDRLLADTSEQPDAGLTNKVTVKVDPKAYTEPYLLVPGAPETVDRGANVLLFGEGEWFAGAQFPGDTSGAYTATAAVPRIELDKGKDAGGITEEKLRAAAGQVYPPEILDLYTAVPEGAIGPYARALLDEILAKTPSDNPYDLADTMQSVLLSNEFTYETNLTDVDCEASAVECFARVKKGYCLHFASTMAILLRDAVPGKPIPTRLALGFLPGEVSGTTSTVRIKDGHAWVEVFFPGFGWIPFDPTKQVGLPTKLPQGRPVPTSSVAQLPSFGPRDTDVEGPSRRPGALPGTTTGGGGPDGRVLLTVFALLLGAAVLAIAFAAWLRGPRGELGPDGAWRSMERMAKRLGYGPRPTQTVYEYASVLGDLVPVAQRDIDTVATAKVETSYAGTKLAGSRIDEVRAAARRLRISLLRLAFRRPKRRRRS